MTRAFRRLLNVATMIVAAAILMGSECFSPAEPDSGGNGNGNPPTSVPTTLTLDKATVSFDAVGAADQLTATVRDQNGTTMTNASITWTSNPTGVVTVSNTGLVTSVANGMTTITAAAGSANGTASATVAQVATKIVAVSGDAQSAPPSATLPESLIVAVRDRLDAGVPGVIVDFVTASGSGAVDPTSATTDASGRAATEWTLGGSGGTHTASATSGTLTGSPVGFSAMATALFISSVSPDTLVEGASASITGQGFNTTPTNNTVMVNGVSAPVVSSSTTSITFTVPASDCEPAQDVDVQVSVAMVNSNTVSHPRQPAQFVNLAVGAYQVIQTPGDFCLQFRGTVGADAYVFGVGAAAETPGASMSHRLIGTAGASFPSAPFEPQMLPVRSSGRPMSGPGPDPELARRRARHVVAEQAIREWESRNLLGRGLPLAAGAALAPMVVPSVGDTLTFKVPDRESANLCDNFIPITTIVKTVGSAGIFVVDTLNPVTDSLTDADLQGYSDTFDMHIYDQDTLYLGTPTDVDNNQRVFVVLTHEVNKITGGIAGFVFSGDLVPPAACASSDVAEIFYGQVPDPNNTAGTFARSKASITNQMPTLIAHEFAHIIQLGRRLAAGGGAFQSTWELEGQATFMEEILGHRLEGKQPGQNYGSTVANGTDGGDGDRWYRNPFVSLAAYYGYLAGAPGDAPEQCTLMASSNTNTTCHQIAYYGASYAFMRFVADHYGLTFTADSAGVAGEARLHREWIGKSPSLSGVPNVEALLGVDFDSLFTRWAMMLWADDRVTGADSTITMLSWNVTEIMNSLPANGYSGANNLQPVGRAFGAFGVDREVRGGSTDYSRISSLGGHGFFSIKVRDTGGGALGTSMKPQLWIVREQ